MRKLLAEYGQKLSPRELQVVAGRLRAHPMKRVAVDLGISESTARKHQTHAFRKLGISCALELRRLDA